ncbi:aldo/keto reductase [Streptococcus gallolyticus]|uniref:aldo/keto reductase n=1 Tax=Streptococcus hepaticus TaxID=3349163 RepID=UPI001C948AF6|nr:aldo/keto reductase [Streptococcus gallolyticus]MBY5042190.1 aldo/keto reductase [Streptococcus gallolyticus]
MLYRKVLPFHIVTFCQANDILLEAYSPLGTGTIFNNSVVQEVGEANGKSVSQVALRWSLQKGFLPLPKSVTPKNIEANLEVFDFTLSDEDVKKLDTVEAATVQSNPDAVNF